MWNVRKNRKSCTGTGTGTLLKKRIKRDCTLSILYTGNEVLILNFSVFKRDFFEESDNSNAAHNSSSLHSRKSRLNVEKSVLKWLCLLWNAYDFGKNVAITITLLTSNLYFCSIARFSIYRASMVYSIKYAIFGNTTHLLNNHPWMPYKNKSVRDNYILVNTKYD